MFSGLLYEIKNKMSKIYDNNLSDEEKDLLALKSDWEVVGEDLRNTWLTKKEDK